MDVSITPELQQLIQRKIDSGSYADAGEVVRDALQRMDEYDAWHDVRVFMAPRLETLARGDILNESFDAIIAESKSKR